MIPSGMTDDEDHLVLRVRGGELAEQGSWIYAWLRAGGERPVVYVGATALHPATRAWLHLNHTEPDIGRVAAGYPDAAREDLDVVAVRVPDAVDRRDAKRAAIALLAQQGLLSERYFGDAPTAADPAVVPAAERLVSLIAARAG
jgi:hypothetical protein